MPGALNAKEAAVLAKRLFEQQAAAATLASSLWKDYEAAKRLAERLERERTPGV